MEVEKQCSCWAGAVPAEHPFPRQKPRIRVKQESDILHIPGSGRFFLGALTVGFAGRFDFAPGVVTRFQGVSLWSLPVPGVGLELLV